MNPYYLDGSVEEYYEETQVYKREDLDEDGGNDYGEEEESSQRVLIERIVEAKHVVETPDREMLDQVYEQLLAKLVLLLETINEDELAFMYKVE